MDRPCHKCGSPPEDKKRQGRFDYCKTKKVPKRVPWSHREERK